MFIYFVLCSFWKQSNIDIFAETNLNLKNQIDSSDFSTGNFETKFHFEQKFVFLDFTFLLIGKTIRFPSNKRC